MKKEKIIEYVMLTWSAILTFITPAIYAIVILLLLMIIDTFLGIKKAKKKGIEITSNRLSDFFAKLIGYSIFIFIGLIIDKAFQIPYIVWILAIIPIYIEIKSINENQIELGKKGLFKDVEDVYKMVLKVKRKRDELR